MGTRRLISALGLVTGAVAIGVAASGGRGRQVDERGFRALNRARSPAIDAFAVGVTELGSIWASAGAGAVLALAGHRRVAGKALTAASGTWLAGQGLKRLFDRPRPYDAALNDTRLLIGRPNATSWPSSHPAVLAAFLTVACRELPLGSAERAALAAVAGLVGLSRVFVGVHYPADVAGGLVLGRAVADALSEGPRPAPSAP